MITCRELIDFLDRYLDGDLPSPDRKLFDEHLAMCDECRSYLDSYRKTIALSKFSVALADTDAQPEPLPGELVHAILASRVLAKKIPATRDVSTGAA